MSGDVSHKVLLGPCPLGDLYKPVHNKMGGMERGEEMECPGGGSRRGGSTSTQSGQPCVDLIAPEGQTGGQKAGPLPLTLYCPQHLLPVRHERRRDGQQTQAFAVSA